MKTVVVLFGGVSSEHDVSTVSAMSVIENISKDKYNVLPVGITKDGRWFKYSGDISRLPEDKWLEDEENCVPAIISPDRKDHGIIVFENGRSEKIYVDVVFPVLHGANGEDGTIQGFMQIAGIPCVGCDCVSSGICMDKALTNIMADAAGICQAKWDHVLKHRFEKNPDEFIKKASEKLGYPIFVKPANAGSSVGISKAYDEEGLKEAINKAFNFDNKVVLEEAVDGQEIECAVLGNDDVFVSIPGEIVPCNDFYDYDAKYISAESELKIPAGLSEEKMQEVRNAALEVYKFLGCSGFARIDFFVRRSDGCVMLNEPNTIPGFTSISMYPKMMEHSGVPYSQLLDRLISLAEEKWS